MILAAVDDLFFKSKISTTAKQLGVAMKFARTSAELLELSRAECPSLIILDLNSRAVDPLATMGALRADAGLAGIPTLGFVSHVQTDLIDRARAAGVTEVMARSAFAGNLEQILKR
ncbi:MAG: response regulator [Acidobacteria bacterium]|nr:response regulator [Acidobacteriota bacterium]